MRRLIAIASVSLLVVVAGGAAANEFTLTVVSQTNSTITFSYPQQPGFGYLYSANGTVVSRTNDPSKTSVKFAKNAQNSYEVASIVKGTTGTYQPAPPPGDTTPPVVTVTAPSNGSTVSGTITVSSTATDASGIINVTFQLDGTTFASDTTAPYSVSFDTTTTSNGAHTFGSRAADFVGGNVGVATPVNVTVSNGAALVACNNGLDDDADGKVDLADPGCSSSTDTDETDAVTPPPPVGACDTTTPNVPGGPDGNGGCFPGLANTGPNAAASTMAVYTGSCTISVANTVIDSKVVNCRTIVVAASGFVLKNSYLNGGIVQTSGNPSFTVQDSLVDSGVQYPAASTGAPAGKYACGDPNNQTTDCGITGTNFTILRTEVINSNRAAYCEAPGPCLVQDNYFHGTNLWPDKTNLAHASSMREEQNATIRHNTLWCSYTGPFPNGEIGCSADLTGYPDFVPIKHNTVDRNLFVASPGSGFCAYGGDTGGKPSSSDPTNATYQVFTNNVFQRGANRLCAAYGPITDFNTGRTGNVWSGNVWSDGGTVNPA